MNKACICIYIYNYIYVYIIIYIYISIYFSCQSKPDRPDRFAPPSQTGQTGCHGASQLCPDERHGEQVAAPESQRGAVGPRQPAFRGQLVPGGRVGSPGEDRGAFLEDPGEDEFFWPVSRCI